MIKPKIVAEIGCNHQGEMSTALKMIELAAHHSLVDVVKFAKRSVRDCLTEEEYNRPHPNPDSAFGPTYGAHREFLEFDIDQHVELREQAIRCGIEYACTVTDTKSARDIAAIRPSYIKVGSWHNLRFDLYDTLFDVWDGDIHVSLGATTREEISRIVDCFTTTGNIGRLVIYACTASYPTSEEDTRLLEINRLKEYGVRVGFSGHHTGIAVDMAAAAMGVSYIERHFTLDRAAKGTDHAASVEADGMRKISKYVKSIAASMEEKCPEILECENRIRKIKTGAPL